MMEPGRWPDDGATEAEKLLIRAGRGDGPRKGADLRMLAAIEAAPPPPLNPTGFSPWMKIGLAVLLAGGGGLIAHRLLRTQDQPTASPSLALPNVGVPAQVAVAPEIKNAPEPARPRETLVLAEEAGQRARRSAAGRVREPAPRAMDISVDDSLGEETKALDRTREALEAHRTPEVMRLLEDYHRRFPKGRLRPEAMVLRLAGLVQGGKKQAAESLGQQLMADDRYRPYLPKIESLLKDAQQEAFR
jgi:hypothetical protein